MAEDTDDFLEPAVFEDDTPEPVIETPAEPVVEPVATVPEPVKEQTTVPLAALQAERAEKQSLKDRMSALEAQIARQNAPPPPDALTDPDQYNAYIAQQMATTTHNVRLDMSEMLARQKHGDDFVNEAFEAAKERGVVAQFTDRKDAWGDLAKWHTSQKALAEIGDDPAAYRARVKEEIRRETLAELAAQSVIPAAPSLAGQPNVGSRAAPLWSGPTPLEDIFK